MILEPPGGVTPEALGRLPGTLEFGLVTLEAVTEFKDGGTILTGALNAVELEKSAGVVVGELEVGVSDVGLLEGERLVVVTPKVGVLTLEGSVTALVMAVLELGVDALETGGVTGDAGGVVMAVLEDESLLKPKIQLSRKTFKV